MDLGKPIYATIFNDIQLKFFLPVFFPLHYKIRACCDHQVDENKNKRKHDENKRNHQAKNWPTFTFTHFDSNRFHHFANSNDFEKTTYADQTIKWSNLNAKDPLWDVNGMTPLTFKILIVKMIHIFLSLIRFSHMMSLILESTQTKQFTRQLWKTTLIECGKFMVILN